MFCISCVIHGKKTCHIISFKSISQSKFMTEVLDQYFTYYQEQQTYEIKSKP